MDPTWYEGMLRRKAAHLRRTMGKRTPSCGSSALPACAPKGSRPEVVDAGGKGLKKAASAPTVAAKQAWRVVWDGKVGVRAAPDMDSERTGGILEGGEIFEVKSEQRSSEGVLFLELADGRGWVFATKAEVGTVCVRHEAPPKSAGQDFLERQRAHGSLDHRVTYTKLQQKLNKETCEQEESEFLGAQGVAGLRVFLQRRFGTISAGWRFFDAEGRGHISFYEFCNVCRKLGFHGNMRSLWKELDAKCCGSISLTQLDTQAAACVETFKQQLLERYGDMATAWKEALDTKGSGLVEEEDLVSCCQKLGLSVDGKKLFKLLRACPPRSTHALCLADFDEQTARRQATAPATAPKEHSAQPSPTSEAKTDPAAAAGRGVCTTEELRRVLVIRKGSILAGWREALDTNGKGRIGFAEFCKAFDRMNLRGDMRGLFQQLDQDEKGYITFADLDKEADALLTDFLTKLNKVYGNTMLAWVKGLDRKGAGCVTKQQFVRACEKVGFAGDAKRLFRLLRPEAGRQNLTMKDFDPKAYQAFTRGDFRMLSETDEPKKAGSLLEMDFEERQKSSLYSQLRKGWDASQRVEFAKACLEDIPEHAVDTAWEFEELCKRKFGSLVGAWRNGLDTDATGKLAFNEFCKQCRLMGYTGNLKNLWAGYGGDVEGHITLKHLDPESEQVVTSFLSLLNERFGSLDSAWKNGFGKDAQEHVSEQELGKVCEDLGYNGSHKKLFRCLRRVGAAHLTIWDLDVDHECHKSRARGDFSCKTDSKASEAAEQNEGGELQRGATGKTSRADSKSSRGRSMLGGMREAMRYRHGSTVAAWSACFGTQETMAFPDFLRLLADCNYRGLRKPLWQELAGDATAVSFKDVDADAQRALSHARELLLGRFGSLVNTWEEGLEGERKGRVDEVSFVKKGEELGMKGAKKVFSLLLSYEGQRSLVREDLRPLLIGLPAEQQQTAWDSSPKESVDEVKSRESKEYKEHVKKSLEEFHGQDFLISSLDTFKQGLIVRCGSLFAAWRNHFDLNQNGSVSKAEFSRGCHQLGVKAVQRLWNDLDVKGRGRILFREFDPEGGATFEALESLLVERYGGVQQGWSKCFELSEPANIRVDQAKFTRQCQFLGVPGNPGKLFKLLRPARGRKFIIYEDLWRITNSSLPPQQEKPKGRLPAVEPRSRGSSASSRRRQSAAEEQVKATPEVQEPAEENQPEAAVVEPKGQEEVGEEERQHGEVFEADEADEDKDEAMEKDKEEDNKEEAEEAEEAEEEEEEDAYANDFDNEEEGDAAGKPQEADPTDDYEMDFASEPDHSANAGNEAAAGVSYADEFEGDTKEDAQAVAGISYADEFEGDTKEDAQAATGVSYADEFDEDTKEDAQAAAGVSYADEFEGDTTKDGQAAADSHLDEFETDASKEFSHSMPLDITIVAAKGLRNSEWLSKADPYCVCEVNGEVMFKTEVVENSVAPSWNQSTRLPQHRLGEALVFKVYEKDTYRDDLLGVATVKAETFESPAGFEGEVPLTDTGDGVEAFISVKVVPSPAEAEVRREEEFEEEEEASRQSSHGTTAGKDGEASYEDNFTQDEPTSRPLHEDAPATEEATYEDTFEDEEKESGSQPLKEDAPATEEASYEDDFAEDDPSRRPSNDAVPATEEASYQDDFAEDEPSKVSANDEASYQDDFAEDEPSKVSANDEASRRRSQEADESYGDNDFSEESNQESASASPSRAGSISRSRSHSGATPAAASASQAEESYSDDEFAADASETQSPAAAAGSTGIGLTGKEAYQSESAYESYSEDESKRDSLVRGGSLREVDRTPSSSPSSQAKAPPSPAAPSSVDGSEPAAEDGNESYDVDDFGAPPAKNRPAPVELSPAREESEEEEDYSEPSATPSAASTPQVQAAQPHHAESPAAKQPTAAEADAEYDDEDFASAPPSSRTAPVQQPPEPVERSRATAEEAEADEEYDDDFASEPPTHRSATADGAADGETAMERDMKVKSVPEVPPRSAATPATASTVPPSSPLVMQQSQDTDLASSFGSRHPLESTAGSRLPLEAADRRPFSPLREEAAADSSQPEDAYQEEDFASTGGGGSGTKASSDAAHDIGGELVGAAALGFNPAPIETKAPPPPLQYEPGPLKVSPQVAAMMERAAKERQAALEAEAEAAAQAKEESEEEDEEAGLYEDDFDPSTQGSAAASRANSILTPSRSATPSAHSKLQLSEVAEVPMTKAPAAAAAASAVAEGEVVGAGDAEEEEEAEYEDDFDDFEY